MGRRQGGKRYVIEKFLLFGLVKAQDEAAQQQIICTFDGDFGLGGGRDGVLAFFAADFAQGLAQAQQTFAVGGIGTKHTSFGIEVQLFNLMLLGKFFGELLQAIACATFITEIAVKIVEIRGNNSVVVGLLLFAVDEDAGEERVAHISGSLKPLLNLDTHNGPA